MVPIDAVDFWSLIGSNSLSSRSDIDAAVARVEHRLQALSLAGPVNFQDQLSRQIDALNLRELVSVNVERGLDREWTGDQRGSGVFLMIDVQVRAESGEIICRGRGPGVDDFFQAGLAVYPLLAHIVPWADTAFNRSQVVSLIEEIGRYEADPSVNPADYSFEWLREICHVVSEEPHRTLWFVGD